MLRMCFIREMSERERESSCRMYRAARMASGWEEEGEKKKTIKISASPRLSFRV